PPGRYGGSTLKKGEPPSIVLPALLREVPSDCANVSGRIRLPDTARAHDDQPVTNPNELVDALKTRRSCRSVSLQGTSLLSREGDNSSVVIDATNDRIAAVPDVKISSRVNRNRFRTIECG